MKTSYLRLSSLALVAVFALSAQARAQTEEAIDFSSGSGQTVSAFRGTLHVPENRSDPESRLISLAYVRFPSTNPEPAAPIVYLAGGPGGSGIATASGSRFPLFMALREVADVIAFDQRGTGQSTRLPPCESGRQYPIDQPLSQDSLVEYIRATAADCVQGWRQADFDLAGYNTWESAADLNDLRLALGADRISLWGISYGTHLGLAAIKRYPARIERAVLASVEGLDETVKLPARTDAYLGRLQAIVDANPDPTAAYPLLANQDLADVMRSVHAQLEHEPLRLSIQTENGESAELAIGKGDLQMFVSGLIRDPGTAVFVPILYANIAAGNLNDVGEIGQYIYQGVRARLNGSAISAMPLAMDMASGISDERLRLVKEQAETAALGEMLNFPMPHLVGMLDLPRLGDDFRALFDSDVPTLFLSGTLDGRTYPESAAETASRFTNATHLLIENAGHNLFMSAPEVQQVIVAFMRGELLKVDVLYVDAPLFPQ